jgi:hypothetical protein
MEIKFELDTDEAARATIAITASYALGWVSEGTEYPQLALSRTQKSYNQNLLYREMSTGSGSNLVLRVPINFYRYTCNNV